jgi:polyribonucleotide nucleotidyltransferase
MAQTISLSLSPPLIETMVKPGKSLLVAYTLENNADPAIMHAYVRSFEPKGNTGAIKIKDELEGPVHFSLDNSDIELDKPFFMKPNGSQQLLLRIRIPESLVGEAFTKASEEIEKLQEFQKKIIAELGKPKKEIQPPVLPETARALFQEVIAPKLMEMVFSGPGKKNIYALEEIWLTAVAEKFPEEKLGELARGFYHNEINNLIHKEAIENKRRPDGRGLDEIRPLFAQAGGMSPVIHGTGIFYRGGTHVFSALTLGGPQDSQIVDSMEERETKKRFMHHYNFPPFSSGETGRMGGLNRRMIGHGALAEKALSAVIPDISLFPYTIRLVSECLASNGSTSMASVCASTLALMDGGVPITRPIAGIASGVMMEYKNGQYSYSLLTDIQGPEDEHGDMDFKVAGSTVGVTAIQMDVKVDGVPIHILVEALEKARVARLQILEVITNAISEPRKDISPRAPKIVVIKIKPDQIGLIIGSAGKTINDIREKTETEIEIEDDGTVFITGKNGGAEKAAAIIADMTREYKAGERFEGVVTKILEFGAFVKIGHSAEGLVHISEIAPFRIDNVTDALKEGETVPVIVKEIDERNRINLSIKGADPEFATRKGVVPGTGERRPPTSTEGGRGPRSGGRHSR